MFAARLLATPLTTTSSGTMAPLFYGAPFFGVAAVLASALLTLVFAKTAAAAVLA